MKQCKPICGAGIVPSPAPYKEACACKPTKITLHTVVIPANLGTDDEGSTYAPKAGAYYDTVVVYQSTGAVYLYDSNGVYTAVEPGGYQELLDTVASFKTAINELYNPATIGHMVKTVSELTDLPATTVPAGQYVLVTEDETHNGRPSLYYWNAPLGEWSYAYAASPYYEKPFIDNVVTALQTNINNVMNKEMLDVDNLQTNINNLSNELEDYKNSPDVRYIKDTYADLEAIDKSTIGDQDYARVLQDETHDDASTYYQFHKDTEQWEYVGQTGPYYTKEQIDNMIGDVESLLTDLDTGGGVD